MKGDLHNTMLYWLNEFLLTKLIDNTCGHGGTAYYIYSQHHYLSDVPAIMKIYILFLLYVFYLMHCNELCLYIVLIWT